MCALSRIVSEFHSVSADNSIATLHMAITYLMWISISFIIILLSPSLLSQSIDDVTNRLLRLKRNVENAEERWRNKQREKEQEQIDLLQLLIQQSSNPSSQQDKITAYPYPIPDQQQMYRKLSRAYASKANSLFSLAVSNATYRSLYAKTAIQKHDIVLSLPHRHLVTADLDHPLCKSLRLFSSQRNFTDQIDWPAACICVQLMHERFLNLSSSHLRPFFASLPSDLSSTPILWSAPTLRLLQGSALGRQVKKAHEALKREFDLITQALPAMSNLTVVHYTFMHALYISRSFAFNYENERGRLEVMAPIMDMVNHAYAPHSNLAYQYDPQSRKLHFIALNDISVGEELLHDYAMNSRLRQMFNHGFLDSSNESPSPTVSFSISLPSSHHFRTMNLPSTHTCQLSYLASLPMDEFSSRCLHFIRAVVADEHEQATFFRQRIVLQPVSLSNELRSLSYLSLRLRRSVVGFPTPLQWDERLINEPEKISPQLANKFPPNPQRALQFRIEEKTVLQGWLQRLGLVRKILRDVRLYNILRQLRGSTEKDDTDSSSPPHSNPLVLDAESAAAILADGYLQLTLLPLMRDFAENNPQCTHSTVEECGAGILI